MKNDPLHGLDPWPREQLELLGLQPARDELLEEIVSEPAPAPSRSRLLIGAGIAAALVVVGGVTAVAVTGGDDERPTADDVVAATSDSPTPSDSAETPSDTATPEPSDDVDTATPTPTDSAPSEPPRDRSEQMPRVIRLDDLLALQQRGERPRLPGAICRRLDVPNERIDVRERPDGTVRYHIVRREGRLLVTLSEDCRLMRISRVNPPSAEPTPRN